MSGEQFKVIDIFGNAFNRGKQYGELKEEDIQRFVEYLYSDFRKPGVCKKDLLRQVHKYIPIIEDYSPKIAEELKGIAKGSGKDYEEIVMITLHEERRSFSSTSGPSNCTSFAATGDATADNETYLGQSWDITTDLCDKANPFLLNVNRNDGQAFLAYTYPGMMAGAGINTDGIGICWNSVPRLELKIGVPTYVIIEEILRQETIGGAIAAVLRADRAGCFNLVIADKSEIYDIEATPEDVDIYYSTTFIGHANHFISDKFKYKQDLNEVGRRCAASSIIRHNRINRMLEEESGDIILESCMGFLKDHVNYPESICRHPDPTTEEKYITCAAGVMIPSKMEWWISRGPPCQSEFEEYFITGV